jgi:hypothetical protein
MQTAVSSSARNEVIGFGGVIQKQPPKYSKTKDLLRHTWRKIGAEPILGRAGSNSTRIENATGTKTVQNHVADEQ